jgi:hypothetical protein
MNKISKELVREALKLEKEIKIAQGKKLTMLRWRHAKIISRINELKNPAPLELKRYDD